jgi:predicted DNA-binding ribbon-helix-helix protein
MFIKYSIRIGEREISVNMEKQFWDALMNIAADRNTTLSAMLKEVIDQNDKDLHGRRLASALRVYILEQVLSVKSPPMPSKHKR